MVTMSKRAMFRCIIGLGGLLFAGLGTAEISVIVNLSNESTITESDIKKIYLGKKKFFSSGNRVIPIDQKEGSATTTFFNTSVLGKSNQQMKTYWSQMLFTGKATPPMRSENAVEIKKLTANNPAIIGYIDSSEVDESVKVVFSFE